MGWVLVWSVAGDDVTSSSHVGDKHLRPCLGPGSTKMKNKIQLTEMTVSHISAKLLTGWVKTV